MNSTVLIILRLLNQINRGLRYCNPFSVFAFKRIVKFLYVTNKTEYRPVPKLADAKAHLCCQWQ